MAIYWAIRYHNHIHDKPNRIKILLYLPCDLIWATLIFQQEYICLSPVSIPQTKNERHSYGGNIVFSSFYRHGFKTIQQSLDISRTMSTSEKCFIHDLQHNTSSNVPPPGLRSETLHIRHVYDHSPYENEFNCINVNCTDANNTFYYQQYYRVH